MRAFHVTYAIATPESAEAGDYAERGYVSPEGLLFVNQFERDIRKHAVILDECAMSLRQARDMVCPVYDNGSWFEGEWQTRDYATGAEVCYGLHVPCSATPSTVARIRRVLGFNK